MIWWGCIRRGGKIFVFVVVEIIGYLVGKYCRDSVKDFVFLLNLILLVGSYIILYLTLF